MAMAHKAPSRAYVCKHTITMHAVERLQEYGTDVCRSASLQTLTDLIDEAVVDGLQDPDLLTYLDKEKQQCWLIPFDKPLWADPGLFILAYDDMQAGKPPRKAIRTILSTTAVEAMKQKGRFIAEKDFLAPAPDLTPDPAPAPLLSLMPVPVAEEENLTEQLALSRREVKALQYELQSITALYKTQATAHQALQQELSQLQCQQEQLQSQYNQGAKDRALLVAKLEQAEVSLGLCIDRLLDRVPHK